MGGPSGPMLSCRIATIWNKSVGPESPPTTQSAAKTKAAERPPSLHCAGTSAKLTPPA
ncbi:DUF6053 domain-containing protein [Lysobacter enzymogenes]|uniref:DUF6053 domain-containing protein n=1 Tax=Lysobacter enzymogenes TaxID=69 RepID=UPI003D18C31F